MKHIRNLTILFTFVVLVQPVMAQQETMHTKRQLREQIKIMKGDQEIAIYHTGDALDKPFIHPLWTPDHHAVTYDAPADHIHHRGLSVGWPDVSNIDFWAEVNAPQNQRGVMKMVSVDVNKLDDGSIRFLEHNNWIGRRDEILVRGEFEWIFYPPEGNLQKVDLTLRLTAERDTVFGSDPDSPRKYHGLTLRIGPFDDVKFYNSEGDVGDDACMGTPAKWCAVSGMQNGSPVTTAIFDHPENSSHPTKFFALAENMQFLSTSPNYDKPRILEAPRTWTLRYRVIAAGKPDEGEKWNLTKLWSEYAEHSEK